jgi:hypothetical protein
MNDAQTVMSAQSAAGAPDVIAAPVVKIASAWGAVAITSWADVASMLAALYTLLLMGEWCWKKFLRPFAERHGWVKRLKRRVGDE